MGTIPSCRFLTFAVLSCIAAPGCASTPRPHQVPVAVAPAIASSPADTTATRPFGGCVDCDAAIVYGPRYAVSLIAPPGWIIDSESAKSISCDALVYEAGARNDSSAFIYVQVADRLGHEDVTLAAFAEQALQQLRSLVPGLVVTDSGVLDRGTGAIGRYDLLSRPDGRMEAVSWLEEVTVFTKVGLLVPDQRDWSRCYPLYLEFLRYCLFLTERIEVHDAK